MSGMGELHLEIYAEVYRIMSTYMYMCVFPILLKVVDSLIFSRDYELSIIVRVSRVNPRLPLERLSLNLSSELTPDIYAHSCKTLCSPQIRLPSQEAEWRCRSVWTNHG